MASIEIMWPNEKTQIKIVHCWVVGEEVEDEEEEETIVVLAVVAAVVLAEELKMLQGFIKQNYFLQTFTNVAEIYPKHIVLEDDMLLTSSVKSISWQCL